jgi:uroporphyrinogen decarboxylase
MAPFGGDYNHQLVLSKLAPEEIKRMYEPVLARNRKIIEHCAKHNVLIAMQGYDFAMNSGCIISPETIRDIYFPFMEMVNKEIEKNGMIPFYHCCGNTWDIMDDFIRVGYKGYQSIQQSAGMDTKKMKEKYGKALTMWTGVQCETLVEGTMEETEKEVREALKILMPGGGFIFGSTNSVQYGAKTDNYLKALEIVRNEGIYHV